VATAGLLAERVLEPAKAVLALPGAHRRFTGSYETGSFTGTFPPTIWLFDNPQPVDVSQWQLQIDGIVDRPIALRYAEIRQLADAPLTALIDCTGGWYSTQEWHGVPLADVLDMAVVQPVAQSIVVRSVTGYARAFDLQTARSFLLATHVAGQPLTHAHGAPLRLVAPYHRGFEWIKWVVAIEVRAASHVVQPPVPLQ
jgi:DMSO/TMAO reductase YedYZ molybdopterin-dependent catalytic subunit